MRTILLFLALLCVLPAAAQERNYESKMTGAMLRGKLLIFESRKNPDGTYTDLYRDSEGNPLTGIERSFVVGQEKLSEVQSRSEEVDYIIKAMDGDSSFYELLVAHGEKPEFREWTGISFEQDREIRLAQWETITDYPPDEIFDIYVRAAKIDDSKELEALNAEIQPHQIKLFERYTEPIWKILSPEQIQKLRELHWAQNGDSTGMTFNEEGISINGEDIAINFGAYKVFGLDPDQQKKLEGMKQEYIKTWSDAYKIFEAESSVENRKKLTEIRKAMQTKIVSTVLTAAQRKKMEELQTNKPKFLTAAAEPAPKKEEDTQWMKSWKPGDPVPEGMLPPMPPSRFPVR